jgi:hypothetical protein
MKIHLGQRSGMSPSIGSLALLRTYGSRVSDFSELDLPSLSEDELWLRSAESRKLLDSDDKTDARRRRAIVSYLKRVNEELGRRRGSRSGNGGSAVF